MLTQVQTFPLESRDDVERFERLFLAYLGRQAMFPIQHIGLVKAYDALQSHPQGTKLFAAVLDIYINLGLLWCDMSAFGSLLSRALDRSITTDAGKTPEEGRFFARLQMHHHASAYVLRYRSIWDKIMGFFVLLRAPEHYEAFVRSRSRKRKFRKLATEHNIVPVEFVDAVELALTKFDDSFRTPEAHGTGVLRKSSFVWSDVQDNPQMQLLAYWNVLNEVAHVIGGMFDETKRKS